MRISVSHNKPKEEIIQAVDRSFTDLFQGTDLPLRIASPQKSWTGSIMNFSLTAKLGFLSTPIKGFVEVTDREVIVDADLGVFERMIPQEKAREVLSSKIRGLLGSGAKTKIG
jgi:hypothetical protein